MRALLDVNVLIALLDAAHAHHHAAAEWWARAQGHRASCPVTQNGCVHVMSQASYPAPLPAAEVAARRAEACSHPAQEFWPADVDLLAPGVVVWDRVLGQRQVTDACLLALAAHRGGRLGTFDRRIDPAAVPGAKPQHLHVLAWDCPFPMDVGLETAVGPTPARPAAASAARPRC